MIWLYITNKSLICNKINKSTKPLSLLIFNRFIVYYISIRYFGVYPWCNGLKR